MPRLPKLPLAQLGIRKPKACPSCGSSRTSTVCRPRPLDPTGLFWVEHGCADCDQHTEHVVQPDPVTNLFYHRQKRRSVDRSAFDSGWDDPKLVVRFRPLLYGGMDDVSGFLSVYSDGRVVPAKGFGWAFTMEPAVTRLVLARGRHLREVSESTGKYESFRFKVRSEDGSVFERTVGFDWMMGADVNYGNSAALDLSTIVCSFETLSYDAGFYPLDFKRRVELFSAEAAPRAPSP